MLKIAICDDDKQEHIHLEKLLQEYQRDKKVEFSCSFFKSGVDLVEDVKNNEYDLILLDVMMPGFSGIQVAQEIRLFNEIIKIVYLSSSPEFALDSYSVGAYGYLLKPASSGSIFSLFNKVLAEAAEQDEGSLVIKSREGIVRIPFCNIEYVEVMNKRVSFHLTDASVRDTSASLLDFEPQLLSRVDFLKVHRSFLIHLRYVQTLSMKGIVTQMGHTIPVSKMLYAQIKESYMKYLFISQPKIAKLPVDPEPKSTPPVSDGSCEPALSAEPQKGGYRILLVDDQAEEQNYWGGVLRAEGCVVDIASTTETAAQLADKMTYDCVVLDVMLFGKTSFSDCAHLRELTGAPVVFLSSLTDSDSQLKGFLAGGTDYITKDTAADLFWAKIEARIRLSRTGRTQLSFAPLLLDLSLRKVLINDKELTLTPAEFDLLWLLAEHAGRVYTPEELFRAVWGAEQWDGGQSIQVHLSRMRRKLENAYPSHCFIETAWGKGYCFVPNEKNEIE